MAHKNEPEVTESQKVQTRYDKKMAARKEQARKDKRDEKIFKIVTSVIGIAIVLAIVISFGSSIVKKQVALKGTYIQIGDDEISQLEFDYYYNSSLNSYLSSYGSLISYLGLDTTQDLGEQVYDSDTGMTWKDLFEEMAVQQMISTHAFVDDANANGFEYDATEDYESQLESIKEGAESEGVTLAEYYRLAFGEYATESNVKPFIEDTLLSNAYYNELLEQNAATDEQIKETYEAAPENYDKVDYRSFIVSGDLEDDATDEEIEELMADLYETATAFVDAYNAGTSFNDLCIEYASEDDKQSYEDDADYSLTEGTTLSYTPSAITEWLSDASRAEGDIEILEDSTNNRYYVVEFISRYYDADTTDSEISDTIASNAVASYLESLTANYEVTDSKGHLNYLTITDASDEETTDADATDADTTDAGAEDVDTADTDGSDTDSAEDAGDTTEE